MSALTEGLVGRYIEIHGVDRPVRVDSAYLLQNCPVILINGAFAIHTSEAERITAKEEKAA